MTRRKFRLNFIIGVSGMILIISIAYLIIDNCVKIDNSAKSELFKTVKELMIPIFAAYIAYRYQQRSSFLEELREYWRNAVKAISCAIQYTHQTAPSQKEYGETLALISQSIDELRALFKNIDEEKDETGLFPFEKVKNIFNAISNLGHGANFNVANASLTRKQIINDWQQLRRVFLKEFDRTEPTHFDTSFIKK
jgi:hypothetical protein